MLTYVKITQIPIDNFTPDKQTSFRGAMATAARVALSNVKISKIEAMSRRRSRRLLANSIRISVQIAAKDDSEAQATIGHLTQDNINGQLQQTGLPNATIIEAASAMPVPGAVSPKVERSSPLVVIGASLGALSGVVLMSALAAIVLSRRNRALYPKSDFPEGFAVTRTSVIMGDGVESQVLVHPDLIFSNEALDENLNSTACSVVQSIGRRSSGESVALNSRLVSIEVESVDLHFSDDGMLTPCQVERSLLSSPKPSSISPPPLSFFPFFVFFLVEPYWLFQRKLFSCLQPPHLNKPCVFVSA